MLYSPAPADTVAYWLKGKPLTAYIDRSDVPVHDAITGLKATGWFNHGSSPDREALDFYLLNHAASTIAARRDPLEPLPPAEVDILKLYAERGSAIAARLFYYMLLITTREARHNHSSVEEKIKQVTAEVQKSFPSLTQTQVKEMFSFTKSCPDSSSILSHMSGEKLKTFKLGPYIRTLCALFYKCSWGSAFGGPAWGNIADALYAFASGQWSAEMMADTAFTLAHNGGPMFNKGMLYEGYTGSFKEILDVQRAGMVPLWLKEHSNWQDTVYTKVLAVMPEIFEGSLDWKQVKKLGALGDYSKKVKAKLKVPTGCVDKTIIVDAITEVHVLASRATA